METIYAFFDWVALQFQTFIDFIYALPDMASNLFSYLQLFIIKMKITLQIEFLKLSYSTAKLLLQDIGFNDLLVEVFNAMPSEVRFYSYAFGIPQGLTILANFMTTAFVMKMSR
ncbi:DUF2523 domain-containing protein [Vibrio makurazakiensis]|uniref:DUF2523 domain-containing protein n=1 Tax=Vibrio makurazakiensis TaxID=2910250 RepID=UPI003D1030EB